MAQSTSQPPPLPFVEDVTVKEVFADTSVGVTFVNGNVHITFISIIADHIRDPAPSRRVVSARLVLPIGGAVELRDTLTRLIDMLTAQGVIVQAPIPSTPVTPGRPH
jgi:hypothetical protein